MIAAQVLADAVHRLKSAGIEGAARDARILLAHTLGVEATRLTLVLHDKITAAQQSIFENLIARRSGREPISQIIGIRAFYGRMFQVTSDVLDPRPDTETLIDLALQAPFSRILDLGTGSGCILLTLLAENEKATGLGVDFSLSALGVAKRNAANLSVDQRAAFAQSDWFLQVVGRFDLIVANPPYIDESEWQDLQPEVRDWEPKMALTPGPDGLSPYRLIAENAAEYLTPQGRLLVEIGWQQGAAVAEILTSAGWRDVCVHQDLNQKDRTVSALRH